MALSSPAPMAARRSCTKRARIDLRSLPTAIVAGVVGGLIVLSTSISYPALIFTGAFEPYLGIGIQMALFGTAVLGADRGARQLLSGRDCQHPDRDRGRARRPVRRDRRLARRRRGGRAGVGDPGRGDRPFDPVARRGLHGVRRPPAGQRDPLHPVPGDRGVPGLYRLAPAPRRDVDHGRSAAELVGKPPAPAAGAAAVLAARRPRGHRSAEPAAGSCATI